MGRAPCCDKENVKRGPWSPEEDEKLKGFIEKYGTGGNWIALPHKAGLKRCGKSCRLRWLNYLRPNIRHGEFTDDEDKIICSLYANIGSRWSIIAGQLPGRTDNDIKNYWNTKLKKKLLAMLPSFQKRPFLPCLQSPPTYFNNRSSSDHLQSLLKYDPNFYNHTTTNLMNLNNMINTSIPTTTTLVQDLSPPDSSNSLLMSLITNNSSINENRSCYLGFDLQGEHDDQSMYNVTPMASFKEASMLVFGSSVGEGEMMSSATTGSSSEGAGSQISYGNNYTSSKDQQHKQLLLQKQQYQYHQIKQEDHQFSFQQAGTQSQISFINHKYYYSSTDEKPKGAGYMKNYEESSSSTLDVKQLIGTTNSSSSYSCALFNDEYKTTHNDDHHKDDMYAIITDHHP